MKWAIINNKAISRDQEKLRATMVRQKLYDIWHLISNHKGWGSFAIALLLALMCYIDYISPPEVPADALYVLPIWLGLQLYGLRGGLVVATLSAFFFYIANYIFERGNPENLFLALPLSYLFYILFCFGANAFIRNQRRLSKAREELQARLEELDKVYTESQQLYQQNLKLAVTEERNRLAREIHDVLAQGLAAIILQVKAAKLNMDNTRLLEERLDQIDLLAHHNLHEARRSVANLRPLPLDGSSLTEALARRVENFEKETTVRTAFSTSGDTQKLSAETEAALYRIAQEALTNVARHAGAKEVQVTLDYDEDEICLTVQDDGRGFEADLLANGNAGNGRSFGLSTMQERARLIGGWVTIQSNPGEGCRIRAIVSYARSRES